MLSAWWIGGLIAVLLVIVAALAFTQAWKPDGGVVQFILRFFIFLLGIAAINLGIAFAGCAMTGLMP